MDGVLLCRARVADGLWPPASLAERAVWSTLGTYALGRPPWPLSRSAPTELLGWSLLALEARAGRWLSPTGGPQPRFVRPELVLLDFLSLPHSSRWRPLVASDQVVGTCLASREAPSGCGPLGVLAHARLLAKQFKRLLGPRLGGLLLLHQVKACSLPVHLRKTLLVWPSLSLLRLLGPATAFSQKLKYL